MMIKRSFRVTNPQKVEFIGKQYLDKPELQVFRYDDESCSEDSQFQYPEKGIAVPAGKVTWLNVHGIHEPDLINRICSDINMPRFIIQDILDTSQRTKFQDLDGYLFLSVKSILADDALDLEIEQISFIVGEEALYSFQEKKGDHYEHIRVRIREDNGLVRHRGTDFLLFLLIEGILGNYFSTMERMEESMKNNADPLKSKDTSPAIVHRIEEYKRKLLKMKKSVIALKDALLGIEKGDSPIIKSQQVKYFYDMKESCFQLLESIDALDQRMDAAENLFFSMQGHRMNQVMTTLTIMAAIFIPLTFMAGIYGMNFSNMPELEWEWGYFSLLGLMVIVTLALIYYFKRRRWF
jgi:magnesium transporter